MLLANAIGMGLVTCVYTLHVLELVIVVVVFQTSNVHWVWQLKMQSGGQESSRGMGVNTIQFMVQYLAINLKEVGPILLDTRTPTKCLKSARHLSTNLR